jgi:cyanophycin synthetase
MRIARIRTFGGPNVHHHKPVLLAEVDLESLGGRESREFPDFNERLISLLPGLRDHTCAAGHAGAFIARLHDGTFFGHIVEHVALELSSDVGVGVKYGKTRLIREPSRYAIVVRYQNEPAMRRLLQVAIDLVQSVLDDRPYPLDTQLAQVRGIVSRTQLGPSTQCIVDAASRRNIPVRCIEEGRSLVQLGYGRYRRTIEAAFTDRTSGIGTELAADKHMTKQILCDAFVPAPRGAVVSDFDEARQAWEDVNRLAVVKPLDGNQGKAVSMQVDSEEALARALELARTISPQVLVEEQYTGQDYRVLVVNGVMVAASLRRPPEVVGDGVSTVAGLIASLNADPRRGDGHEKPLTRIAPSDSVLLSTLSGQGLSLDSVPETGRVVLLRSSANLSTGGSATDVTALVHPDVRTTCERAARLIGLDICGLDVITPDIAQPFPETGAGIIEVNAGPGLRMHQFPSDGASRDVGGAIVDMLFPRHSDGRIPVVAITGTNGKTTVTRMISHAMHASGANVGTTTTDGIYLNGRELACGDMTGPRSARAILSDPDVDIAVLETARGGIVRGGLGYDWSDVAVFTNLQLDHVGQDGIEGLEDLLHIKSLVVERVREGGTVVLNADDPMVLSLAENRYVRRHHCRIALFSMYPNKFVVRRHIAAGGTAYVPRDGWIVEMNSEGQRRIAEISAIPATFAGTAACNVANALASVAACRGLGASAGLLRHALNDFDANGQNSGRLNVFNVPRGRVVIDYGHNPSAFEAMGDVARSWKRNQLVGVVGVPGDRADHVIHEAGRAAARMFDRFVIKEDEDGRGRERGETARLLQQAIAAEAPGRPCDVILDEAEALSAAIETMAHGDVVVLFYDDLSAVKQVLERFGATPATARRVSQATEPAALYGT